METTNFLTQFSDAVQGVAMKFRDNELETEFLKIRLSPFSHYSYLKYGLFFCLGLALVRSIELLIMNVYEVKNYSGSTMNQVLFISGMGAVTLLELLCGYCDRLQLGKGIFWMSFSFMQSTFTSIATYGGRPGVTTAYAKTIRKAVGVWRFTWFQWQSEDGTPTRGCVLRWPAELGRASELWRIMSSP
jgi:hypothetical protein